MHNSSWETRAKKFCISTPCLILLIHPPLLARQINYKHPTLLFRSVRTKLACDPETKIGRWRGQFITATSSTLLSTKSIECPRTNTSSILDRQQTGQENVCVRHISNHINHLYSSGDVLSKSFIIYYGTGIDSDGSNFSWCIPLHCNMMHQPLSIPITNSFRMNLGAQQLTGLEQFVRDVILAQPREGEKTFRYISGCIPHVLPICCSASANWKN